MLLSEEVFQSEFVSWIKRESALREPLELKLWREDENEKPPLELKNPVVIICELMFIVPFIVKIPPDPEMMLVAVNKTLPLSLTPCLVQMEFLTSLLPHSPSIPSLTTHSLPYL